MAVTKEKLEELNKVWHFDAGKPAYQLLPPFGLHEVARVASYGEQKYGAWNWADYADEWNWLDLIGSLLRHTFAFLRGEWTDPESKLPHMAHAAFNALMILDLYLHGKGTDDRSPLARQVTDEPPKFDYEEDKINYDLKDEERPLTIPGLTPFTREYWRAQIDRNIKRSEELDRQLEEAHNDNPPWEVEDGQTTQEAPPGEGEFIGDGRGMGGNDPCATWSYSGSSYPAEKAVSGLLAIGSAQQEARESERGRR